MLASTLTTCPPNEPRRSASASGACAGSDGLSQRELAEPGLSYAYLSRLEAGQRLIEAGLLVGLVGALGLAGSGRSRGMAAIAGLLLAVGLGLVLVVVHFGVSPFRHR